MDLKWGLQNKHSEMNASLQNYWLQKYCFLLQNVCRTVLKYPFYKKTDDLIVSCSVENADQKKFSPLAYVIILTKILSNTESIEK